jgi:hypothetical protein
MKAMSSPLDAFVSRVSAARRLNFGDLRRLQRDILPDGPATRDEVAALIGLDAALDRADEGWLGYLVNAVKDFMTRLDAKEADTRWLASVLTSANPRTALTVARAVVDAVDGADDTLRSLAKVAKRKPKAAACTAGLTSAKIAGPVMTAEPQPVSFAWPDIRFGDAALTVRLKR